VESAYSVAFEPRPGSDRKGVHSAVGSLTGRSWPGPYAGGTEVNTLLWFREEYLVVLGQRRGYWLLRTAYCTDKSRRIAQLKKERDAFRRAHSQND
jgi:hypothetical protein